MANTRGLYRICIHHTGGTNKPNAIEKKAYHFLVDGNGKIHKGNYEPEANIDCKDGEYAQHCGLGNTGCIGVAFCGNMANGKYPLTRKQLEAGFKLIAELVNKYNIEISHKKIYTHMEYDKVVTFKGKIDIDNLPQCGVYGYKNVGDYIRNKVLWYKGRL